MSLKTVLIPVFLQVALTFFLLFWMGFVRLNALKSKQLKIKDIALGQNAWPQRAAQISNSFHNQLELPILFYVVVILAIITKLDGLFFVILEWVFVVLRFAHMFVHTGSNNVQLRFNLFITGALVLLIMWIMTAVRLLTA